MKFLRVASTLGTVFKVYSFFLLIPFASSLYWDEAVPASELEGLLGVPLKVTTASFLATFLFVFFLGLALTTFAQRAGEDLREREAFFIVGAGWFLCALLGAIPFLLVGATDRPMVAFFEAMSALTTTGYSALDNPLEQYAPSVHMWRSTLQFFGGMGIILVLVAIVGRLTEGGFKLMSSETGGETSRIRPTLSQTAKSLFVVYLLLNVLVFIALWVTIRNAGYAWKDAAYHAIVHAFGTVATGGMSTLTASVEGFRSTAVETVVFTGMFLGAVSFLLHFRALTGQGLRVYAQSAEFRFFVTLIVGATLLVSAYLFLDDHGAGFSIGHSAFMVMSAIATCGYTSINADLLPDGARLTLLLLMFTGGMVGSTVGAIKVARIQLLFQMTFRELERLLHPHAVSVVKMGGRIVPEAASRRIVVFFFTYVTTFIAGAFAFAVLGYDLSSALVASGASLGGVGFGWGAGAGFASPATDAARLVAILLMWLGRLEIFTVLLLFVPGTYKE